MAISILLLLSVQADGTSSQEQRELEAVELFNQSKVEFRKAGKGADEQTRDAQIKKALALVQRITSDYNETAPT